MKIGYYFQLRTGPQPPFRELHIWVYAQGYLLNIFLIRFTIAPHKVPNIRSLGPRVHINIIDDILTC